MILLSNQLDFEIAGSNEGSNTYSFGYKAKDAANNETTGNITVKLKMLMIRLQQLVVQEVKKLKDLEPV